MPCKWCHDILLSNDSTWVSQSWHVWIWIDCIAFALCWALDSEPKTRLSNQKNYIWIEGWTYNSNMVFMYSHRDQDREIRFGFRIRVHPVPAASRQLSSEVVFFTIVQTHTHTHSLSLSLSSLSLYISLSLSPSLYSLMIKTEVGLTIDWGLRNLLKPMLNWISQFFLDRKNKQMNDEWSDWSPWRSRFWIVNQLDPFSSN